MIDMDLLEERIKFPQVEEEEHEERDGEKVLFL